MDIKLNSLWKLSSEEKYKRIYPTDGKRVSYEDLRIIKDYLISTENEESI